MSSFCGANLMRNPFAAPAQARNGNVFVGSFAGSISEQQHTQNPLKKESVFQFDNASANSLKSIQPKAWISEIWQIHAIDTEPAILLENARVEFLERIRPQQKADRAIAIGLNRAWKKSSDAGPKTVVQQPFLNALAINKPHSLTPSGGLSPHFLA